MADRDPAPDVLADALAGGVEATALYAGHTVGVVREVLPGAEVVGRLAEEAEAALRSARGLAD